MHLYTNNAPQQLLELCFSASTTFMQLDQPVVGSELKRIIIFLSYLVLIQMFKLEMPIQTTRLMYHNNDKSQRWVFITHFRT